MSESEGTAPSRAWPIGKTWDGRFSMVKPEHTDAYAAATNDDCVAYYGPGAIAPPMFHVRLFRDLIFAIARDPELDLDLLRLVHGEHDATFHRVLHTGDLVQLRARLESVDEKASGLRVASRLFAFVEGELAVEARTLFFVRAPQRQPAPSDDSFHAAGATTAEPKNAPPPPAPDIELGVQVTLDQSHRYAPASLDDNPIHTDPAVAATAGLPDVILHGLCTMALAGNTLTAKVGGNNPAWLRRLSVRFASPVFNGQRLALIGHKVRRGGRTHVDFLIRSPDGKPVITHAVAEFEAR